MAYLSSGFHHFVALYILFLYLSFGRLYHLQSCIKVALDFVSPENVVECIRLTNEFRLLPKDHCAKDDKLEVWFLISCIRLQIMLLFSAISSRHCSSNAFFVVFWTQVGVDNEII